MSNKTSKYILIAITIFILLLLSCDREDRITNSGKYITWEKTIGGDNIDVGMTVLNAHDGGYLVAGYTSSFGNGGRDIYLIKLNNLGDTLWTRTIGGSNDDVCNSAIGTTDGCYLLAGYTESFGHGNLDAYLVKVDSIGDTIWTRTYGGPNDDVVRAIISDPDGGYVIAGETYFSYRNIDAYVIKINLSGDAIWIKNIGSDDAEEGYAVASSSDGGFFITGEYWPREGGKTDVYLAKLDSLGDTIWTKTLGGDECEYANAVASTQDGGCIVAGVTWSWGGTRPYVVRVNANGDEQWMRLLGGSACDEINSLIYLGNGYYAATGYTNSFGDNWQFLFIKFDISGNLFILKTLGTADGYEEGNSIVRSVDGGLIFTGRQNVNGPSNIYIVKTDPYGNL